MTHASYHDIPEKFSENFQEISEKYSHFLLDMWGVVHDGFHALPGAINTLNQLRVNKKKILFISNSSRPAASLEKLMDGMGIHRHEHYDHIHSSGDAVIEGLSDTSNKFSKKHYYYLGDTEHSHPLLPHIKGEQVLSLDEASYVLLTALTPTIDMVLEEALEKNLTLICANPDIVAPHGKVISYCPGLAAQKYEKKGGHVIYYGKPFPPIYESSLKKIGSPPLKNILTVGDSLHTDIKGANAMGLDSLLIHSGIHHADSLDMLKNKFKKESAFPTYILSRFNW